MTPDEDVLADIRTMIDGLPKVQRLAIQRAAQQLREFIAQTGSPGLVALALVGAENAA